MSGTQPARSVVVRLPDSVGGAEHSRLLKLLQAVAADTWRELGLPSSPSVDIESGRDNRIGEVIVDGRTLRVSARSRQQIAIEVTGRQRALSEPRDEDAFVGGRFADAPEAQRDALVAGLVRASVRASVADLVSMDARVLAAAWLGAEGDGHVDVATRAISLAGTLGVAPSQLDPAGVRIAVGTPDRDPYLVCEDVLSMPESGERLAPVLEMSRATLRRLTASPRPIKSDLFVTPGPILGAPGGIRPHAYQTFGVRLPPITLAVADEMAPDRFRVRFGPVATSEQLVLPEALTAVDAVADHPVDLPTEAEYLDPIHGAWWPLTDQPVPADLTWHVRYHSPAALVVRGLYATLQPRLAWWARASIEGEWGWGWGLSEPLAGHVYERLPAVLRWLAAGSSAMPIAPVIEGVVASLAEGDMSVPALVRGAREKLRGAVLGPLSVETTVTIIDLDEAAVDEALATTRSEPLFEAHPALGTAVGTIVAVGPAETRAQIEGLLSGVRDVVRVASRDELEGAAVPTSEQPTNGG